MFFAKFHGSIHMLLPQNLFASDCQVLLILSVHQVVDHMHCLELCLYLCSSLMM